MRACSLCRFLTIDMLLLLQVIGSALIVKRRLCEFYARNTFIINLIIAIVTVNRLDVDSIIIMLLIIAMRLIKTLYIKVSVNPRQLMRLQSPKF